MFVTRIISASILLPPVVAAVYYGSPFFDILIAAFVVVMAWEWETITTGRFSIGGAILALAAAAAAVLVPHLPILAMEVAAIGAVVVFTLGLTAGVSLRTPSSGPGPNIDQSNGPNIGPNIGLVRLMTAVWLAAGSPYIMLPTMALVWLRATAGLGTVLWLLGVVWATDIGAYLVGRSLGGPLLAPRISPKKTWSGAVGGLVAAMAVGATAATVLGLGDWVPLVAMSAVASVVSQVGDLGESAMKRRFGVKDSGWIIPGHGGVLDRVDGLVPVAPLVAVVEMIRSGGLEMWG